MGKIMSAVDAEQRLTERQAAGAGLAVRVYVIFTGVAGCCSSSGASSSKSENALLTAPANAPHRLASTPDWVAGLRFCCGVCICSPSSSSSCAPVTPHQRQCIMQPALRFRGLKAAARRCSVAIRNRRSLGQFSGAG